MTFQIPEIQNISDWKIFYSNFEVVLILEKHCSFDFCNELQVSKSAKSNIGKVVFGIPLSGKIFVVIDS